MTRHRMVLSLTLCTALALTGCGAAAPETVPSAQGDAPARAVAPEGAALEAVELEAVALEAAGFAAAQAETDASPSPSVSASAVDRQRVRPRAVRKLLRQNTLHGEVVVRGRDGERTIVVQRGAVTASDDSGFTVRSTDGFQLTWAYGDPLRLVQDREKAPKSAVREGAQVAVGGVRDGAATAARLIVVD